MTWSEPSAAGDMAGSRWASRPRSPVYRGRSAMATVQHRGGITPPPTGRLAAWVAWMEHGEPRPVRGPFTRWPRISDVLLAAVVFVASVLAVAVSALPDGADLTWASVRDLPVGAFVLLAPKSSSARSRPRMLRQ